MLRHVHCIDVLEVVKEIIPRRWKRFVITPITIVVVLLSPWRVPREPVRSVLES